MSDHLSTGTPPGSTPEPESLPHEAWWRTFEYGGDCLPLGGCREAASAESARQVTADALSMLLDWDNGALSRVPAEVTVCFERVRPDEVRGTVRAEVFDYPYGFVNYYPSLVYRYPFDITYPERSGFDATLPDAPADMPDGYATAQVRRSRGAR